MAKLKTTPILAAKTLGPALMNKGFENKALAVFFDKKANGLNFDKFPERRRKSINRKMTGRILPVTVNTARNNTVKAPFKRATCSSIFLFDMGQNAVVFILFIFII
jgi:hypothetical protein